MVRLITGSIVATVLILVGMYAYDNVAIETGGIPAYVVNLGDNLAKMILLSFKAASGGFRPKPFLRTAILPKVEARSFSYLYPAGTIEALTISLKVFASISRVRL